MELLEYQAKELFREIGIPVLPSQRIDRPGDLKGLRIPYPVVLKSQVPIGGRGRAGGIKFVENTIDAIAAAQTIFHLPIKGEYPEVLLAEARYNAAQEFYLAVTLDYTLRRPVLLGSAQGGVDVEAVMAQMQQVVVEQEFSPFYARRLALKMGLQGSPIGSVSAIIEKMYKLFVRQDLDLVEINPLGVSSTGEVMALDGKVTVNDAALGRHPDLVLLAAKRDRCEDNNYTPHCPPRVSNGKSPFTERFANTPEIKELEGNIAIICNGKGLVMATLDSIYKNGGKPGKWLNVSEDDGNIAQSLCTRLERSLEAIERENGIKVILINILGDATSCNDVARTIAKYLERIIGEQSASRNGRYRSEKPSHPHHPHLVVRLASRELDAAKEQLAALGVHLVDKLDKAAIQAVSLTKTVTKRH